MTISVVTSTGRLYAFGENNSGQLGSSSSGGPTPTLVTLPGQSGSIVQIAAGSDYSFALTSAGQLYGWGDNFYGQLGIGTSGAGTAVPRPASSPGEHGSVTQVAAGGGQTLVVTSTGQLYAFGFNYYGQLGNNADLLSQTGDPTPTLVALPGASGPATQVAATGT